MILVYALVKFEHDANVRVELLSAAQTMSGAVYALVSSARISGG